MNSEEKKHWKYRKAYLSRNLGFHSCKIQFDSLVMICPVLIILKRFGFWKADGLNFRKLSTSITDRNINMITLFAFVTNQTGIACLRFNILNDQLKGSTLSKVVNMSYTFRARNPIIKIAIFDSFVRVLVCVSTSSVVKAHDLLYYS